MINIGLLGLGNVGSGIINILEKNAPLFNKKLGVPITVKSIFVRDLDKARNINTNAYQLTANIDEILDDTDINLMIEVMGNEEPALTYITKALNMKKHVVTANKELISKHKNYLFKLARKNRVNFCFEASVCGGIPIIHTLKVGFGANSIQSIYGILNGTTNYVLTKMEEETLEYKTALSQAQKKGFAEANPNMDISGLDAAYKLDILAATAFQIDTSLSDIYYEGLENISLKDIKYASEFGYRIKLLAIGQRMKDNSFSLKIHPTMIKLDHPLAAVRLENNAVLINGDAVGESMLYGKGAGSLPTASSILADVLSISEKIILNTKNDFQNILNKGNILNISEICSKFYTRLIVVDSYGVLEKIAHIFGANKVSILKVIQKDYIGKNAEVVIITHQVKEKNMQQAIIDLKKLPEIIALSSIIRVGLDIKA